MASQAAYFGAKPPPPVKKANTPSSTTTESSSSKTKNGVKTITTKYVTTTREPTDEPDMNTNTINQEKREYNDGTTDDITLTRKILGGMKYDIETIIRVQTIEVGSKKTKTTYATPYQELDPVTGKPIAAFKPVTHTGAEHTKTPEGLAEQIGARAPKVSGMSHNVVPVTTGPGAPPAPAPAPAPAVVAAAPPPAPAPAPAGGGSSSAAAGSSTVSHQAGTGAPGPAVGGAPGTGGASGPATSAAPATAAAPTPASTPAPNGTTTTTTSPAPGGGTTTTTTTVVEEGGGCCVIL